MDEAVEQLADSEIVQCAAEKDRRDLALAVAVEFERRINAFDELQIVAQVLCERIDVLVDRRVVELYVERLSFGRLPVFGEEQRKPVGVQVVHALERRTRADRPGQRPDLNLQLALDLVEQVERVLARAVETDDKAGETKRAPYSRRATENKRNRATHGRIVVRSAAAESRRGKRRKPANDKEKRWN